MYENISVQNSIFRAISLREVNLYVHIYLHEFFFMWAHYLAGYIRNWWCSYLLRRELGDWVVTTYTLLCHLHFDSFILVEVDEFKWHITSPCNNVDTKKAIAQIICNNSWGQEEETEISENIGNLNTFVLREIGNVISKR